jgi:hypothetical protein
MILKCNEKPSWNPKAVSNNPEKRKQNRGSRAYLNKK